MPFKTFAINNNVTFRPAFCRNWTCFRALNNNFPTGFMNMQYSTPEEGLSSNFIRQICRLLFIRTQCITHMRLAPKKCVMISD